MSDSSGRFFEGLLVGGIMGFLFGMLAAPKSGADLRRQIADGGEDLYKNASDNLTDFKGKAEHALNDFQHRGEEVLRTAKDQVASTKTNVSNKLQEMAGHSTQVLDDVESATSG
ncbi:MAG: YtxH domain-containing protein [Leptolyngbya sp.]|nr:YtxH domain-containing protein [Candidatus Melainabacteria bacterium]